jgi:hypothetical protein
MSNATIERMCAAVSADAMMQDLAEFARRIKLSGTRQELESFHYLQRRLETCGFRTRLIHHDAYISLPGAARLDVGNAQVPCITHSFSQPSGPGGLHASLVHVGAGTAADFAAADVRGKVALIDGIAVPATSARATEAGAIGQVHISPHEHLHEMCISPVWGSPTDATVERLPRAVVLSVALAHGNKLKQRLAREGVVAVTLHAVVDTGWRQTPILVADMSGPGPEDQEPFVMFSGHHDTWHYGVMDNGSANATMLEVARLCAAERAHWRRGLRLCFWSGHSHGRYSGSTWYADHHWNELEQRCVVHVNVDSTGGKGAVVLADTVTSAELRALAQDAVGTQGNQTLVGRRMGRAGDQSFWGIGVPSIFMGMGEQPAETTLDVTASVLGGATGRKGAGFGWWWHTPDDTLDKIDPQLLVRDTRVYVHAIWRLLHDPVLPFDYAQHAADLLAELDALHPALHGRFDTDPIVSRATELRTKAAALRDHASRAARDPDHERINHALMQVSRALVPMDYTSGDRFGHDPALRQSAWPPLDSLRRLAGATPGSTDEKFLAVAATRDRNRVAHALRQAIAALDVGLAAT